MFGTCTSSSTQVSELLWVRHDANVTHYQLSSGSTLAISRDILHVYRGFVISTRYDLVVSSTSDSLLEGMTLPALHEFLHLRDGIYFTCRQRKI